MDFNKDKNISSRRVEIRTKEDLDILEKILFKGDELFGDYSIINEYEKKLASFFEVEYAIAVSSDTAALHIALEAIDIR